ncbi:farnesyltranstransferase [Methanosarcinales archaeon ex4572_44]|nr:MAG: farnesyltranstransferase [Methanosarcinales archaeon ex4484_138]PHP45586.1 MAG: farnesyltranstransferase [Methanosarcinales archaeon ex4572_44]RLG26108.1 MAG: polyprenyl synthetase family protein [Methanosarcinales archaeon]RLG27815.1 MAG: polyprenyl synthetase family protein [Methanosarcinales archaeon]
MNREYILLDSGVVAFLDRCSALLDRELAGLTLKIKPKELSDAVSYGLESRGKRIRPAVAMLSCLAVGGSLGDAKKVAVSAELVHTSSLVLDDVIDKAEKRRGRETIHTIWGENIALLTIELLISLALHAALGDVRLTQAISKSLFFMGEGEAIELVNVPADEESYLDLALRKTGALFGASAFMGAVVGGGDDDSIESLEQFGNHFGIAFQIQDDILDCVSSEEDLGKPVRQDLFMGRPSIVLIDAVNREIDTGSMLLCNNGELMDLVSDSIEYARGLAAREIAIAREYLHRVDDSGSRGQLESLCDYILNRER